MGNAYCNVTNDTKSTVVIATYSYSDMVNYTPFRSYVLRPRGQAEEYQKVEASADQRGLRVEVQFGDGKSGLFNAENNARLNVSDLLKAYGGSIPVDVVKAIIDGTATIGGSIAKAAGKAKKDEAKKAMPEAKPDPSKVDNESNHEEISVQ